LERRSTSSTAVKDGTLAIDLGSSSTVVAFQASGGGAVEILSVAPFSTATTGVIPSLIWVANATADQVLVGRQVQEAGLAWSDSPQLCRDFKRRVGAGGNGPDPGCLLSPEQANTLLLRRIWDHLPPGVAPSRLVLTAPIDGYRGYRQWLEQASGALAVEEVALVDEPTAAAIGAGLPPGSRVLVVDLGGGTIDLSFVALEGGEGRAAPIAQLLRFGGRNLPASRQILRSARVLGKAGLALGGRDLDRWIAAALTDGHPSGALLEAVERLKCRLSDEQEAGVLWCPPGEACRELRLNRTALESLLKGHGLLDLLDDLLERVLAGARAGGLDLASIDAVLPVGGSSRIPLVRAWLRERCSGIPILDQRPIEAVALGALALTPGVQIKDVLSRGVSLRRWDLRSEGYRWHPLFLPGQSWPTGQPLELVLACSRDGQRQLDLVLGEPLDERRNEVVFRNGLPELSKRPAGEIRVEPWARQPAAIGLDPPGTRGVDRLRLRFRIDGQGHLTMDREDLIGGQRGEAIPLGPVR
jgi:molecular chaperone DnaK (HSP70)